MRKLITLAILFLSLAASAQVRSYEDMETKTFVIGLSMYYFGDTGTLTLFSGTTVNVSGNRVVSGGKVLLENAPAGNTLIGAHDFTDDGTPELVVATRGEGIVKALIYRLADGTWELIGTVGARGDVEEIRVFRQALTAGIPLKIIGTKRLDWVSEEANRVSGNVSLNVGATPNGMGIVLNF